MIHWIVNLILVLIGLALAGYWVKKGEALWAVFMGFVIGANLILLVFKLASKMVTG